MAPPFMNAHGLVTKIFDKIIEASQPDRFTVDFLATKLGYESGSARPIIPLLKKLGFVGSDGSPTPLYGKFRNPEGRGQAMATALRAAYKEVFDRNEYAYDLPKEKFKNLIVEMTGLKASDPTVNAIVGTFFNLLSYAKFDAPAAGQDSAKNTVTLIPNGDNNNPPPPAQNPTGLNLSYTINLNLPETSDVEVFNAIFRSLKENLLKV
jgi:hypothetical protein